MSGSDLAGEDRRCLRDEPLTVVVRITLGEVGQHEQTRPGLGRDPARLARRQVPILVRERGVTVSKRGLAYDHVRALGKREGRLAEPSVHDESKPLPPARLAHLLHRDPAASHHDGAFPLETADVWASDPMRGQLGREHPAAVRLGEPVPNGCHAVRKRPCLQAERRGLRDRLRPAHRSLVHADNIAEERCVPQSAEQLPALRRVAGHHNVANLIERHPLQDTRQAQAVIPVEMGYADAGDLVSRDTSQKHLALGAFTRVEEQPFAVPEQQVTVVVAAARGRLARRTQDDQFTVGHNVRPYAGHARDPMRDAAARPSRSAARIRSRPPPHPASACLRGRMRQVIASAALPADIVTPCLVVDADVLDRNLSAAADWARDRGLALRPHAKTHKCPEIASRQVGLGAVGLTVATVGEGELFAAAGFTNLFIAYPVWASGTRGDRLRALAEQASLRVGADSAEAAQLLAQAVGGAHIEVLVEIDSGQHRSGVRPELAGEVALAAERAGLHVAGVFTFPGHGYAPGDGRGRAAADEARAMEKASASMREAGVAVGVCSGGSTPTLTLADPEALTEVRPGVYAFNDAQQAELGSCGWQDVALSAAATVVSISGRNVVLDAGGKVLGADKPAWASGYGRLLDHPEARVVALSEHHATVAFPEHGPLPARGDVVRVAPNHVCAAVNLADELVIVSRAAEIDRWRVAARGLNA